MRLPKSKAPGPDIIPNMAIRWIPWKCPVPLTKLFNGILRIGHFPEAWRLGKVVVPPTPSQRPTSAIELSPDNTTVTHSKAI
ncbi:unnamed protein product [Euphydryas editha]|uniref:RNA-directed DNA polymerase from mobile element jockey n=1 Tax=Euphydryas editha TaxID=104508 RepID=A0AAU9UJA0_EUPED|nr:unnamed protein product [Euphydryas editha]